MTLGFLGALRDLHTLFLGVFKMLLHMKLNTSVFIFTPVLPAAENHLFPGYKPSSFLKSSQRGRGTGKEKKSERMNHHNFHINVILMQKVLWFRPSTSGRNKKYVLLKKKCFPDLLDCIRHWAESKCFYMWFYIS